MQRPLPEIIKQLTIDAGEVGPVILSGESKLKPADGVKLEIINIESR